MSFTHLKKFILASGMMLTLSFNNAAQAQNDAAPTPTMPATEQVDGNDLYTVQKQFNEDGKLVSITRYKDGQLNDGPAGEAAVQNFADNGVVIYAWHYKAGILNDGQNGEPAVQNFAESGALLYQWHYKNGKLNDGANGESAVQSFGTDGKIVYAARYKNGKMNDGANGECALQRFDSNGKLTYAARYKGGELVKVLSRHERKKYKQQVHTPVKTTAVPKSPQL